MKRWWSYGLLLLLVSGIGFTSCQRFWASPAPTPTPVLVAQGGEPTLVIYPDRGPAGSYVQVTGADWPGETLVIVMVADDQGRSEILARETTSGEGRLATGFLYPFDQRWLTPGAYTVIAEAVESGLTAQSPFVVGEAVAATPMLTPTTAVVTATATIPLTPTLSPTPLPTATITTPPTATAASTATSTPLPPTPVPNQPPTIAAALVPVDEIDAKGGRFRIDVTATDPEGDLQGVLIVLKVPTSERDRAPRLRENRRTEITFTANRLEIRAPDPQALLDQINAYGGILVENGQVIDWRVRNREGTLTARDDGWRLDAPTLVVAVGATDGAGLSTFQEVIACVEEGCPGVAEE